MAEFNLEATDATGMCQASGPAATQPSCCVVLHLWARHTPPTAPRRALPRPSPQFAFQGKAGELLPKAFGVEAEVEQLMARAAGGQGE